MHWFATFCYHSFAAVCICVATKTLRQFPSLHWATEHRTCLGRLDISDGPNDENFIRLHLALCWQSPQCWQMTVAPLDLFVAADGKTACRPHDCRRIEKKRGRRTCHQIYAPKCHWTQTEAPLFIGFCIIRGFINILPGRKSNDCQQGGGPCSWVPTVQNSLQIPEMDSSFNVSNRI